WIVALADDRPDWKNRLCDELLPWPGTPTSLADIFARLAGGEQPRFRVGDWPPPPLAPDTAARMPAVDYAVLHVGAGSPLRLWAPEKWRELAHWLVRQGVTPVWSAGPGENDIVTAIDPGGEFASFAAQFELIGLWHFIAQARLLVCLDTAVAH